MLVPIFILRRASRARRQGTQRDAARARYKKMEKLPQERKEGLKWQWEEYNRLPEQERRKLGSTPRKPSAAAPKVKPPATASTEQTAPPEVAPATGSDR